MRQERQSAEASLNFMANAFRCDAVSESWMAGTVSKPSFLEKTHNIGDRSRLLQCQSFDEIAGILGAVLAVHAVVFPLDGQGTGIADGSRVGQVFLYLTQWPFTPGTTFRSLLCKRTSNGRCQVRGT